MTQPLLQTHGLSAAFRQHVVLREVGMTAFTGEVLGILGANGAGKTTLLRMVAGLYAPQAGTVEFDGIPLADVPQRAQRIAYLEQHTQCHWPMAVERLVTLGRMPHLGFGQSPSAADEAIIEQAMREADVLHLRHRPATELSSGEQARVFLARALAVQPQLLLVDEPVAGLDPAHQLTVMDTLARKAREGMAVVAVLHDLPLAARFCDRLLLLHDATVLAQGTPHEVLTQEHLKTALQVTVLQGEKDGIPYSLPWQVA